MRIIEEMTRADTEVRPYKIPSPQAAPIGRGNSYFAVLSPWRRLGLVSGAPWAMKRPCRIAVNHSPQNHNRIFAYPDGGRARFTFPR